MKRSYFLNPKRWAATLGMLGIMLSIGAQGADARLIFTTEEDGVNSSGWTIDLDDESPNFIDLNFGSALGNQIRFDIALDKFVINNDVDFSGNQLVDLRLENVSSDPVACAAGLTGRMYFNTTDSNMYFCDGSTWNTSNNIAPGSITNAMIAANAINSSQIIDGAVGTADLADNAVTSSKIFDGSIATADLADGAVNSAKITDGSIATADLADDSVTSAKIDDGTIVNADLAANSVNSGNIVDGSITTDDILDGTIANADLAANSVNSGNIVDGSVTGTDILDGTVELADLDADSVDSSKIVDGSVANADLAANSVNSGNIVDGSVALADLDSDSVNSSKIVDGSVTGTDILDGTVDTADLAGDSVTSAKIADGSVSLADLNGNSVDSSKIVDGSVSLADLNGNSVDSSKIVDGSVTGTDILDGTVATADLAANSVTSAKIVDGTITQADVAEREASITFSPEFPNFTVQADGSNNAGTLESDHDSVNKKNYYQWSTRKSGTAQDYDIVFQWAIPEDFQGFSTTTDEILLDYKTNTTVPADNAIDVTLEDSAGTTVVLTGGSSLVSSTADTWVDDHAITFAGGTFTPGEYMTVRIKLSSKAVSAAVRNPAYVGAITFNYIAK